MNKFNWLSFSPLSIEFRSCCLQVAQLDGRRCFAKWSSVNQN